MKLSVALIVKNEAAHLATCLASVADADEIVVCDTGSTDDTVAIAKQHTPHVYTDYTWNDDFAEARNHAKNKCTGDWVLSIDADEVLEPGGIAKIREAIANAAESVDTLSVVMHSNNQEHHLPRIFKRLRCFWVGRGHESLSPVQKNLTDIRIQYGHSTAHALDPNRMWRIMQKAYEESPSARNTYYLARELYYRRDWRAAYKLFKEAANKSNWQPEKADALLYMAYCLAHEGQRKQARDACGQAVIANPDCREALMLMGTLSEGDERLKWYQFAEHATNQNVLFKRYSSVTRSKIPKKLHHIWVGPNDPPLHWMQTWREKNPDWDYMLWDNDWVFSRTWINQKHVDYYREREIWHGVADVVRYEILNEFGGFMPGADSECLLPIDELFTDGFEAYACYENEHKRPGFIAPLYASQPGGRFVQLLIEGLYVKDQVGEPWKTTGNLYMKEMYERYQPPIKVFPSHTFIPKHYTGHTYRGNGKVYAKQHWGMTLNTYEQRQP
jgi:glycosyltransferase involved in cell wall biosynthesis